MSKEESDMVSTVSFATEESSSSNKTNDANDRSRIQVLPATVVRKIAAGEIVQRAAAAVKELIENSLDAGSTEIIVTVEGANSFSVSDNGQGMDPDDLALAATRHATSKLRHFEDLKSISSFGFRGEALAAVSELSRLTITSRTARSRVAYQQSYDTNGKPLLSPPKSVARLQGTTVSVQDLFFNLRHRKGNSKKLAEEYNAILTTMQQYAIHYASARVGMICQQKGRICKMDLNTTAIIRNSACNANESEEQKSTITKQVIAQVYGSKLFLNLFEFDSKLEKDDATIYESRGFFSTTSFNELKRTVVVLFVNHRLVECPGIKRAMEAVYGECANAKQPFFYLSLQIPPDQVDVNVHPTKKQVTLLHFDEICANLTLDLRRYLCEQCQTFSTDLQQETKRLKNPYKRRRQEEDQDDADNLSQSVSSKKKTAPSKMVRTSRATQSGSLEPFVVRTQPSLSQLSSSSQHSSSSQTSLSLISVEDKTASQKENVPARKLPLEEKYHSTASNGTSVSGAHDEGCPVLLELNGEQVDLAFPGAFATILAKCTCIKDRIMSSQTTGVCLPRQAIVRPKKILPTECEYTSIRQLRKRIAKYASTEWHKKLRSACFVGVVGRNRCVIQCGEELVLMDHYECAKETFYQCALNLFGGAPVATFGAGGVDIAALIANHMQTEEFLDRVDDCNENDPLLHQFHPSEVNILMANEASQCLHENAEMLQEYFSIHIEKNDAGTIVLTGLPNLVSGYIPNASSLPSFLLNLATEVDWSEEKPCFHGICRELAQFYAQPPDDMEDVAAFVRHKTFPVISTLLIPSEPRSDKRIVTMTSLSRLYKVFERC